MAVFKCKMCGGALEIANNETVAVCEYCGTQQTLPKLEDERRINLYDRANHFRRSNDYDKAMSIYEQILNEDSTDAEAYWSLVLCRYGIEYVEDPFTHKRVPTVNRAQFTSIYDDVNYKMALQHADIYQKSVYEGEAKAINEIQKGILAISQREEPFDVFICYKETDNDGRRTQDSVIANDLYHQLTQEGFKVFFSRITLEDKIGTAYEPYIFAALNSAKAMVVIGTKPEYFNAVWVKNEWNRYLAIVKQSEGKKILIPAYKDMDPYDLPEEFSHLQAQDMGKLGFMQDLIRGIKKITASENDETEARKDNQVAAGTAGGNMDAFLKRAYLALEDGEFDHANAFCNKVLNYDAECAEAYLGMLLSDRRVKSVDLLKDEEEPFDDNSNFQKVLRFGNDELKEKINGINEGIKARNNAKQEKEKTLEDLAYAVLRREFVKNATNYITACDMRLVLFRKKHEDCDNRLAEIDKERKSILAEQEKLGAADIKKRMQYNDRLVRLNRTKAQITSEKSSIKDEGDDGKKDALLKIIESMPELDIESDAEYDEVIEKLKENDVVREKIIKKYPMLGFMCAQNGDVIRLGKYEKEPLKWRVIDIQGSKKLLLLDEFFGGLFYTHKGGGAEWVDSYIRDYLNDTFLIDSFTYLEETMMYDTTVPITFNSEYETHTFTETVDKLFLLSEEEVNKYLRDISMRKFLRSEGDYNGVKWWLRTPGETFGHAEFVDDDGKINTEGERAEDNMFGAIRTNNLGIRPAMWIGPFDEEYMYQEAISEMEKGEPANYEIAISLFESISGWGDATDKISECRGKIEEYYKKAEEEEKRREKERQEAEIRAEKNRQEAEIRTKRNKKIAIIVIPIICALIAAFFVVTKVVIPNKEYNEAISLMNAGKTVEAYEAFIALEGYKDSAEKADSVYVRAEVEKMKDAKAGDTVLFGAYEQDNDTSNGKESIEWLVLEVKDGRALVISKEALEGEPYNEDGENATWETCTLRNWLNNDFINDAFSEEEKTFIPEVTVSADKNPEYDTKAGKATQDKVFLLSIAEADKYFTSDSARQCQATAYAEANGTYVFEGTCCWWLRSPGYKRGYAAEVSHGGSTNEYGTDFYKSDTFGEYSVVNYENKGVRPALWIDLKS